MDLFLIRHAIAEERSPNLADHERQLTDVGRARFTEMVNDLARGDISFDHVYTSPWVRAVQTAQLLAPVMDGKPIETERLARAPEAAFFASLEGSSVACVGHEPWMSDSLALLTTGDPLGSWVRFKKGAIAWLRGEPHPASMHLRALWIWKGH